MLQLKSLQLSQREKTLLQAMIGLLGLVLVYYIIIGPVIDYTGNTQTEMENNIKNIEKIEKIYEQYRDIQQKKSRYITMLDNKNENTTSLIEQWATTSGIAKNIAYTRRNQSFIQNKYVRITTDVKFEGVAIQAFLKFLYEIESSNSLLNVNYLRINQGLKGSNTYDVNIKIDNYILK